MPSVTANIANEVLKDDADIIRQFLVAIQDDIRQRAQSAGKVLSGKTINSMRVEVTNQKGKLVGAPYFTILEDGRAPTKDHTPGNPTVREQLLVWLKSRSIQPRPDRNGRIPTLESLAYVMARQIHTYGDKLFQRGGKSGIISGAITKERVKAFTTTFGDKYRTTVVLAIRKEE